MTVPRDVESQELNRNHVHRLLVCLLAMRVLLIEIDNLL